MSEDKKIFASIAQLCREKGLDRRMVRAASALGLPGFNTNRTVNWDLLEPALKEHEAEIQTYLNTRSTEELKREKLALENEKKRLEIKKLEGTYVDPAEWYSWHAELGTKLSTQIKAVRKNLMAKCMGYEGVVDNEFLGLFSLIEREIEKCRPQ